MCRGWSLNIEEMKIQHRNERNEIGGDGRELLQLMVCLITKDLKEMLEKIDRNRVGLVGAESSNHYGTFKIMFTACLSNMVAKAKEALKLFLSLWILSFVDKDQMEPGCAILMHNNFFCVIELLQEDVETMESVIKVEKTLLESYADIGWLEAQI